MKKIIKKEEKGLNKELESKVRLTFYVSRETEKLIREASKKDGRSMSNFMDLYVKNNF